jgi:hypothetical protein
MFVDQTLQPNDPEPIREILPEDLDRISGSGGTVYAKPEWLGLVRELLR